VNTRKPQPIGVILAGGVGRRIGGDKAIVELCGRPLISYPLAAMGSVTADLAVVAKSDTRLPPLAGISVWIEPDEPRHPVVGLVHALERASGRPVLVCAADMPLITAMALQSLADADTGAAPAVIATGPGGVQPQLGRYEPAALAALAPAAAEGRRPLRETVAALGPALLEVPELVLFNVNTAEDLARAEERLQGSERFAP
jgi:molybdopterin-guanine dinucleotide biosynthesis protein A